MIDLEQIKSAGKEYTILELNEIKKKLAKTKINVLLVGATGAGKSSTINALFTTSGLTNQKAQVGEGAQPETMDVSEYTLSNMVIWDTPGLGDSLEKDKQHQEKITKLLQEKDEFGAPLIDLILLVLDGSSRDLGSIYTLIKEVIAPQLDSSDKDRLLVGMNKADKVMHSKFWDFEKNQPSEKLNKNLEDQSIIIQDRIFTDTGFKPEVIFYSAGEIHEGELVQQPYNLLKLLSFIIEKLPHKKRLTIEQNINQTSENFEHNDNKENYQGKIEKSLFESLQAIAQDALGYVKNTTSEIFNSDEAKAMLKDAGITLLKALITKKL